MTPAAIKAFRESQHWSQQQLADALRVRQATVADWETGHHRPKGQRLEHLRGLVQQRQSIAAAATRAPAPPPFGRSPQDSDRTVIRIADAVRQMGLKSDGHGQVSDRTIRTAIKLKRLPAWQGPGTYKAAIPEWYFYQDDFDRWRREWYVPYRDPRRNQSPSPPAITAHAFALDLRPRLQKR